MAVVETGEVHDGREGGDEIGKADLTRRFWVRTNNNYDGADIVLASTVAVGTAHPTKAGLFVATRRAVNDRKSKRLWWVTLRYGTQEYSDNPLLDAAKISWDTDSAEELVTKDNADNAILNTAGDYYEDGVKETVLYWRANVRKNVALIPDWFDAYRFACNSDTFTIDGRTWAPYQARVAAVSIGEPETRNNVPFRVLSLSLKFRDSWRRELLDQGLRRKDPSDSTKRLRCVTEDGKDVSRPVLLDGSGGQLANPGPTTAVFNTHAILAELPFSILPLS